MGQVGSVCACNGSQPLALSCEKALPVGHPHRRNFGIRNGDLFGETLMPGKRGDRTSKWTTRHTMITDKSPTHTPVIGCQTFTGATTVTPDTPLPCFATSSG